MDNIKELLLEDYDNVQVIEAGNTYKAMYVNQTHEITIKNDKIWGYCPETNHTWLIGLVD